MSVLIVSAVGVSITIALLLSGLNSSRSSFATEQSNQAKNLANACAEESLQVLNDNSSFLGSNDLSLGQGDCTYTVLDLGGGNRTIQSEGTVDGITRRIQISLDSVSPQLNITSWQEVSNF